MDLINCLVIDDEPLARETVENYIQEFDNLTLVRSCSNAIEAINVIKSVKIDLIFLDINMPKLSGLDMLKALDQKPAVVFTTAYPEYAVDGFELDAIDYLVKPFGLDRFLKAINKVEERLKKKFDSDYIAIKADKKIYNIKLDEIKYLEAMGDYVKVFTNNETLITHQTMKSLEELLPSGFFLRIHKSFIVSFSSINFIEGNQVKINDQMIPIGASFKDELLKRFKA